MAYAKVYQPFDMGNRSVWYGDLFENSSDTIEIRLGSKVTIYEGDFRYGSYGSVAGTLNSVTEYDSGGKLYEINGFAADAGDFYSAIQLYGNFGLAASYALSGNDTLIGSAGSDGIYGFSGKDLIKGRGGNDVLVGNDGGDRIIGGRGNDDISGGAQRDTLRGGTGQDYIQGDAGNDKLFGGSGKDVLWGGSQSDRLNGGRGDDELAGGAGRDTFVFSKGGGHDTILDFEPSKDMIEIGRGASNFRQLDIVQDGNDAHISFANVEITVFNTDADDIGRGHFIF
jgi:Ca2+-binding RTX toxin-like protein